MQLSSPNCKKDSTFCFFPTPSQRSDQCRWCDDCCHWTIPQCQNRDSKPGTWLLLKSQPFGSPPEWAEMAAMCLRSVFAGVLDARQVLRQESGRTSDGHDGVPRLDLQGSFRVDDHTPGNELAVGKRPSVYSVRQSPRRGGRKWCQTFLLCLPAAKSIL